MTSQVNDKEFSVTLTMYFAVRWEEPRLTTNNTVSEGQWTPIDLQFLNHLWVPNIFIYDLRSFAALNVLKKLAGVWIVEGKEIYYNQVSESALSLKETLPDAVYATNMTNYGVNVDQSRTLFIYFCSIRIPIPNVALIYHRCFGWDSNPDQKDGRCRQIH